MIGWEKLIIKKIVGAVLLDFSAAFHIIDHNLVLKNVCVRAHCLLYCGFRVTCLTEQRVFNRRLYNIIQVEYCIPQGSYLDPLLFKIFTNDLPLALSKACVSMYAGYTRQISQQVISLQHITKSCSQFQNGRQ
jgi:hypothetical protein